MTINDLIHMKTVHLYTMFCVQWAFLERNCTPHVENIDIILGFQEISTFSITSLEIHVFFSFLLHAPWILDFNDFLPLGISIGILNREIRFFLKKPK